MLKLRWTVYAGGRECRQLALVWVYIQQGCAAVIRYSTDITDLCRVVRDFGFTLNEMNWLGNIHRMRISSNGFFAPILTKQYGLDVYVPYLGHGAISLISLIQSDIASILLLSGWVRYAGTARSLSKGGAYALVILGQVGRAPGN